MKIKHVHFDIWIESDKNFKNIENEKEAEDLLAEICRLITSKGYYIPSELCGPNPTLSIHKS